MPKTIDAFALREFDEKRILQRPFFRNFHFDADKTDEEILQSLSLSDNDSLSELEQKYDMLKSLRGRLGKFDVWIERHLERLNHYGREIKKKIDEVIPADAESLRKKLVRVQVLIFHYSFDILGASNLGNIYLNVGLTENEADLNLENRYQKRFSARLQQARRNAKKTQQQVGDEIGLSQSGFALYERGKREPSITSLIRLAKTLNVSTDWLIGVTP